MEHCKHCGSPDLEEKEGTDTGCGGSGHMWAVCLFNCECHSFLEVEIALARAGIPNGKRFATIIHNKGSAVVFEGTPQRAEAVAMILESYGLKVKITQ